jgi:polar amino acid transport system substrate-binding protein
MVKASAFIAIMIVGAGLAGCGLPRDPARTTDRVEGHILRVGVVESPPWAVRSAVGEGPVGVEPDLVRALARRMRATPVYTFGPEAKLLPALKRRDLDLVIGGFTTDDPWTQTVAVTRPFMKQADEKHVLLAPPGENRWLLTLDRVLAERTTSRPARRLD